MTLLSPYVALASWTVAGIIEAVPLTAVAFFATAVILLRFGAFLILVREWRKSGDHDLRKLAEIADTTLNGRRGR